MTAKEKANELLNKYVSIDNDIFCSVNYPYSKQCAIIAVDEIIDELKRDPYTNYERIVFWKAVKTELNKL